MRRFVLGILVGVSLIGCKDLTNQTGLPAGTQDPAVFNTPVGAFGMWASAVQAAQDALPGYLLHTGLLTDELTASSLGLAKGLDIQDILPPGGVLDERILPEQSYGSTGTDADYDYDALQQVRALTTQALGAVVTYDTGARRQGDPLVLRSQLYAFQGYAEILLADFFCSGIPLSTLDFQKDYTYAAGSPTDSVYAHAILKLDSAYILAKGTDSVSLQNLAQVLKGRAWLARGQYDSAAAAVAAVPDTFTYTIELPTYVQATSGGFVTASASISSVESGQWINSTATVANDEGLHGLPFLSGDPRTAVDTLWQPGTYSVPTEVTNSHGMNVVPLTVPAKYCCTYQGTNGNVPFILASGTEARLIQAEVALHTDPSGSTWLTILNNLRANAPIPGTSSPDPQALPPLTDPGASANNSARLLLLFRERAFWLFLTGHRQGDLRRLVRQYGFAQNQVYPSGTYLPPGGPTYGSAISAPIPGNEYINPKFQGCLSP